MSMDPYDIVSVVYSALLPVLGADAASVATGLAVDLHAGEVQDWCGLFWLAEH